MAELIAKEVFDGQAPMSGGGAVLAPLPLREMWSVSLFPGKADAAGRALSALDLSFPGPGRIVTGADGAMLAWTGREQAMLIGAAPPRALEGAAAITDQTDGWAGLLLSGAGAADVLARLVPVDLRPAAFGPGSALRAPLNHMQAIFLHLDKGIAIHVFRSMARTAWHELTEAMAMLEARGTLRG